uniref:Endonuclease V n=1 Tax=candidate division WOR-3 bacterium TaxID=2052148 RepID=A0A7C6ED65_UNCW3
MPIPKEFIVRQRDIAEKIVLKDQFEKIELVGGADVAFDKRFAYGAFVVLSFPELKLIEQVSSKIKITFPYIPGFLSFREEPAIVTAYKLLKNKPDIILFDGQGIAHPKRAGLACALGITLDRPTIGCAKTRLIGEYTEPPKTKGSFSLLLDNEQIIGYVLRTKDNTRPIFVSPGHKVSLITAKRIVLACCTKFRIPEPLRYAHSLAKIKQIRLGG